MTSEARTPALTLKEEYRLTQQMIELLKQEQAHLIKADIEGLIAITEEKSHTATQMAELANQRYLALAAVGCAPQEGGMQTWFDTNAPDVEALASWQNLLKLAKSAKSMNNTNGLLIHKHMAHNQKALNVLCGNVSGNFYGPNGKSTTNFRPRGLVVG
ncbi:MAG TPA: flagellar protein FlgN [Burkholderiaceae bacterium]|jgi:flagella synthesis protein FlgN|nr:flagellar protein FlgN [Burkholderiaceae bacterium]